METLKDLDVNLKRTDVQKKFITYEEAEAKYHLCESTLRRMARDCNALYKFGKAARIKVEVFEKYIETFKDESYV